MHRFMTIVVRTSFIILWAIAALGDPLVRASGQTSPASQSDERQRAPVFTSRTDLVPLNVTVSDGRGAAVTGLTGEDFRVYEDDVEQPISFFSKDQRPASWGLVLDRSGSMQHMMHDVYEAALHAIEDGTDEDQTFIATFNSQVELLSDFVTDKHRLENAILGLRAGGETALWDAVAFALNHIRSGQHRKRVLMVITDGEDNRSELPFRALIDYAERAEVLIYPVGMMESMGMLQRWMGRPGNAPERRELEKLAEVTGARAHFPLGIRECRETMAEIAREVSHQYSLGYYPTNARRDGKWRRIRVEVAPAGGVSSARARTRPGYYASTDQVP